MARKLLCGSKVSVQFSTKTLLSQLHGFVHTQMSELWPVRIFNTDLPFKSVQVKHLRRVLISFIGRDKCLKSEELPMQTRGYILFW